MKSGLVAENRAEPGVVRFVTHLGRKRRNGVFVISAAAVKGTRSCCT